MTPTAVRLCSRACAALVAATALLATVAVGAEASDGGELLIDLAGDGRGFVQVTDEPWLSVDELAPGSVRARDLVLWNTTDRPAALHLQVSDLDDDEHGCIAPERRVPGEECDADGGELSSWLTLELVPPAGVSAAADPAPTLAALAAAPHELPVTIGAGEQLPLTMRLRFLPESVNDTQTDQVAFDLRLTASHDGPPLPDVLGDEESRDAVTAVSGPRISAVGSDAAGVLDGPVELPLTGATLPAWVLLLDLLAVLAGATMVVLGVRRRGGREPLAA